MKSLTLALATFCLATLTSCVSWTPPSKAQGPAMASGSPQPPAESYRTLKTRANKVATEDALRQSIKDHQRFVQRNPRHTDALSALAEQQLLLGTAYTNRRSAKRSDFLQAKQACEDAMATDPGYAARIRQGAPPWEACEDLGRKHMDPMLFWVTSVLYMFREGMVFPQQIFESEWLDHAGRMLDHMKSTDRNSHGGAVLFSQAIVYHAVPPAAGGDPAKARAYLKEATELSGTWMLSRWGRAKYFLVEPGDQAARAADLKAILALDPASGGESPYWRRYFQADARRMLEEIDPAAKALD